MGGAPSHGGAPPWAVRCLIPQRVATLALLATALTAAALLVSRGYIKPHAHTDSSSHFRVVAAPWEAAWAAAAARNVSRLQLQLLSRVLPALGQPKGKLPGEGLSAEQWAAFAPVLRCPPGRPLTRYGGPGDGSKILCSVEALGALSRGCVIYSLGSKGVMMGMPSRALCMRTARRGAHLGSGQPASWRRAVV